ncbi:MAG: hypothetical protein K2J67_04215 [Lachnospiraceae bacterium]|nr:hypothetical protein [Lachnospiraceae bacterium]
MVFDINGTPIAARRTFFSMRARINPSAFQRAAIFMHIFFGVIPPGAHLVSGHIQRISGGIKRDTVRSIFRGFCPSIANVTTVHWLVWMHMKAVIFYITRYEKHFRAVMEHTLLLSSEEKICASIKRLEQVQRRMGELDRLFIRIYEDNVAGHINDEQFSMRFVIMIR